MKLLTLAMAAAIIGAPAVAFADSSQPNSKPGAEAPAGSKAATTTGKPAADSSVPGATNANTSSAPARAGTTGAPAADSSVPGASKK